MSSARTYPPGPRLPAVAQALRYTYYFPRFWEECRERYGHTFTLRLPGFPPGIVTTNRDAIRRLLTLQGTMKPHQIISLMTVDGTDNTLSLPDHADHIHVGFAPEYAPGSPNANQLGAVLKPSQWVKLIDRLGQIDNPAVATTPSRYAIKAPQLFVASGATTFGKDFKQYPWTIGYQPNYRAEGTIYGRYVAKTSPKARIAPAAVPLDAVRASLGLHPGSGEWHWQGGPQGAWVPGRAPFP